MSYTTKRQPQGCAYFYTNKIREAMIAELVAINDYAYHIAHSDIKDITETLQHIMEDEKEHYGMFLQLLRKYDPAQFKKYMEVKDHLKLSKTSRPINICVKPSQHMLLNFIRDDIKGELEAVILYEQHIMEIPIPDIRETFLKVINDEKEHTEELTRLLIHYDKDKYGPIK